MDDQARSTQLPILKEHDFHSNVPILAPLIQVIRRGVYRLTAKWSTLSVIKQQNEINALIAHKLQEYEERLINYEERLIDQDRDLTQLTKNLAEIETRQKYLMKQAPRLDEPEQR